VAVLETSCPVPDVRLPLGFETFYRSEREPLYRALALTLSDAELAREAVDEAMVRAYQRWGHLRTYDNPAGWVYRVGLNWAVSWTRRARRALPVPMVPDDIGVAAAVPADAALAAAVAALGKDQRAVIVLRFHLDWSVDQIAAALRLPAGTVKSRLHRALATLRMDLEPDDGS
jgi:DNA-directed RNA polymerase specialized sigma24 family protein